MIKLRTAYNRLPLPIIYIFRSLRILLVTIILLALFPFRHFGSDTFGPRLVRRYFEICGGGFVKLGQLLSMRYDLIPAEYCRELSILLDSLTPYPAHEIIKIIEDDLGRSLDDCFAEFERKPLSTASVAQVHAGKLKSGEKIVVKVRRPGIEKPFKIDLFNIRKVANMMDNFGLAGKVDVSSLATEFSRSTHEELDFRREAMNAAQLNEFMQNDELKHYSPKVYFEFSSLRVLTLEKLEGVWMRELIDAVQSKDSSRLEQFGRKGIYPREVARLVLHSTLTQMFSFRVFHADPHAANLVLLDGGILAYLDFGIVGWLDERLWAQQFKVRKLVAAGKIHAAYEAILVTLEPLPLRSLPSFEREAKGLIRDWILASSNPQATILEKSSGFFFLRLFDAIRRTQLTIPFTVMNLYRTMIIADIVMLAIDPQIDWMPELKKFVDRESKRQVHGALRQHYSPANVSAAFLAAINSQTAVTELIEWLQYRLPEASRGYKDQLSRVDQLFLMCLVYVRFIFGIFLLIILGAQIIPLSLVPSGVWSRFIQSVSDDWWIWSLSIFLAILILSRFINVFRHPE